MSDGSVLIDTLFDTTGFKKGLGSLQGIASKFGTGLKTAFKMGTIAIGTTATAIAGLAKASVESYAEYEQLRGGIESIFGGYEKGSAQIENVAKRAENAWEDLTMSTSDYYRTFSTTYPLMKNDIEDQNDAIEQTNRLMKLESDLANTFGYSIENASTAINWALKGSFNYIDNLNLGIKGTQEGFIDAAHEAGFYVDSVKDLGSSDILKILEYHANKFGVIGKTEAEAATTIQGSIKSLKASWDNFLNGSGQISTVIETLKNAINNILNATSKLIPQLISSIAEAIPQILESAGQIIQALSDGITNNLPQILTCATSIINSLLQGLMQLLPEIAPVAVQMIFTIVEAILPQLPNVLDCGFKVVIELIKGITQELPSLLDMAPDIIKQIVEVLIDNLPELLEVSLELIQVLIEGLDEYITLGMEYAPTIIEKIVNALMEALPKLMPVAVNIITTLIDVMTQNLPFLIECAYTLIITLAEGIIRNLPQILSAGGQIIWALIDGIINLIWNVGEAGQKIGDKVREKITGLASEAWGWGSDLVQGFIDGIKSMFWRASSIASDLASKVSSFLHFSRPDRGPLRDYEKWMPDMVKGLARSLKQASPLLERQASALATKLQNAVAYESSVLGNSLASNGVLQIQRNAEVTATLNSIDNDKEITVNAITNLDSKVLTQAVNKVNARQKLAYGLS